LSMIYGTSILLGLLMGLIVLICWFTKWPVPSWLPMASFFLVFSGIAAFFLITGFHINDEWLTFVWSPSCQACGKMYFAVGVWHNELCFQCKQKYFKKWKTDTENKKRQQTSNDIEWGQSAQAKRFLREGPEGEINQKIFHWMMAHQGQKCAVHSDSTSFEEPIPKPYIPARQYRLIWWNGIIDLPSDQILEVSSEDKQLSFVKYVQFYIADESGPSLVGARHAVSIKIVDK